MSERAECTVCDKEIIITGAGKLRVHGRPECRGSGQPVWPMEGTKPEDLRPTAEDVKSANYAMIHGAPDDVWDEAEDILDRAQKHGIRPDRGGSTDEEGNPDCNLCGHPLGRHTPNVDCGASGVCHVPECLGGPNPWRDPLSDHQHRYEYLDDEAGHSGSFCAVCDSPEPTRTIPQQLPYDQQTEDTWTSNTDSPTSGPGSGSSRHPTESVRVAGALHSRERTSVPTGTADTRDGSAAMAPLPPDVDVFLSAAPAKKIPVDGWKRYKLPHPVTGKVQSWTRATTFAGSIEDMFGLGQWQQRMVAKGLSARQDLVSLASTLDVKADRDRMNSLVEQAKDHAGQKIGSNTGTAVHKFTEHVDSGGDISDVPEPHRADVLAYRKALVDAGFEVVPHLIERTTVVTEHEVAGTLDRILRAPDGSYVIGDVKTAQDMSYSWQKTSIQLALYARGVNEAGVWDLDEERWEPDPLSTDTHFNQKPIRTDYGIVMHAPAGSGTCTLYRIDLEAGWEAAVHCAWVRSWRKRRGLAEPYVPEEGVRQPRQVVRAPEPPSWEQRFHSVSSRAEASSLWHEALPVFGDGPELRGLVSIAMGRLAALGL